MEEVDNPEFDDLFLTLDSKFSSSFNDSLLNGITVIEAVTNSKTIKLIPYYAWDNRDPGQMKVWINYKE